MVFTMLFFSALICHRSFGLDLLSIDQFLTCYDLVFAWKMELAGRVCHMIFLAVNVAQGRHSQERKVALDLKIWSMLVRKICPSMF